MNSEHLMRSLREQVFSAGFGSAISEIVQRARPCVYVIDDRQHEPKIGECQYGLTPDLPASVNWPVAGEPPKPGEFLFQLALEEIPELPEPLLPSDGHLWFFVHQFCDFATLACTVLYNTGSVLARRDPLVLPKIRLVHNYGSRRLAMQPGVSLPLGDRAFRERVCLMAGDPNWDRLHEALQPNRSIGQIGGYAYNLDGNDILRDTVMIELGQVAQISPELYNAETDLEAALARTPAEWDRIRPPRGPDTIQEAIERQRPATRWLEQHRSQVKALDFLLRLETSIADCYPIWVFRRKEYRQSRDFGNLLVKCHP